MIVTGEELLQGQYADRHTQFVTWSLRPLGLQCVASLTVGDRIKDLNDALDYAVGHTSLVIVTGGLGPTDDDVTREALSEFTEIPLRQEPEVLSMLKHRFAASGGKLRRNLRRQALIPAQGSYLPNPNGTAVGLIFDAGDRLIVALPGPPRELQPMLTNELIPLLTRRFGTRSLGSSLQMRFAGIGESTINQTLHDHLTVPQEVTISSLFEAGRVDLRLSVPGNSAADRARLKAIEKELMKHIGEYMYTDDDSTLEECVVGLLEKRGITIGLAEVASGGAVAASLMDVNKAAQVMLGGFAATSNSNMAPILNAKRQLLVSPDPADNQPAKTMAGLVCKLLSTDWGVAVAEQQTSEDGSRFAWFAAGSPEKGFSTGRLPLRGRGHFMRSWLVTYALDSLRRRLVTFVPGSPPQQ
jgi:nicotinamide-nucleotide amidase